MNDVTVLLMNWKREKNLKTIIERLKKQTVKPKIFLWDNNPSTKIKPETVDWYCKSTKNTVYGRWMMASLADTEYIMTMDDDIIPKSDTFIQKCMLEYKKHDCLILGIEGKKTPKSKPYYNKVGDTTDWADIIKGKFMFMRTDYLKKVKLKPLCNVYREDDIYVSFMVAEGKQAPHYVSRDLRAEIIELGMQEVGMQNDKTHMEEREIALQTLMNTKKNKNDKRFCELLEETYPHLIKESALLAKYPEEYLSDLLNRLRPKRIVEVGTYKGVTTNFLASFPFVKQVITIDVKGHPECEMLWSKFGVKQKINRLVVKNDTEKQHWVNKFEGKEGFDLVFIDGDHSYSGVKFDFELLKDKTKYVLFHDFCYTHPSVMKIIKENSKWIIERRLDLFFALWGNKLK